jgi:hypothetical protein
LRNQLADFFMEIQINNQVLMDDEDYEKIKNCSMWVGPHGYVVIMVDKKMKSLHRHIMGEPQRRYVDHINGNRLDNRKANLRICDYSQSRANSGKKNNKKPVTSQYKGVCKKSANKNWSAYIAFKGERYHLGYFGEEIDAARAYDERARELFGGYARLNFPS